MQEYQILINEKGISYLDPVQDFGSGRFFHRPDQVKEFMKKEFHMDQFAEEYLCLIALNQKGKGLGIFEVSHGTAVAACMESREIFVRLCLCGATGFILVHNHPSGDTEPSEIDIRGTRKIMEAAELMKIQMVDHIIIGEDYFSFREAKLLT